ncbi:hypothetical protein C6341_g14420 [Phytophthora cactorum]|nr:hypothetical protein C6341_g14420 [Phytophthora cactorum]
MSYYGCVASWRGFSSSKKQCNLDSCKDEYVTTANTFVDASAADYASYFQQYLDCPPDKTQESHHKLFIRRPGEGVDGVRIAPNSEILLRYFAEGCESEHLLEERSRKKQWQTGYLNKKNYVTAANSFVDASAAEYIWQCLDCPLGKEEDAELLMETKLQWKEINSETFVLDDDNTSIVALVLGLYVLGVVLNLPPAEDGYCTGDEWCRDSNSSYMLRQLLR